MPSPPLPFVVSLPCLKQASLPMAKEDSEAASAHLCRSLLFLSARSRLCCRVGVCVFSASAIAKKGLGGKTPSLAEIEMVSVRSSFPSMNILPRGCHSRTLCSFHQRSTSNSTPCSVHGSAHTRRSGCHPAPFSTNVCYAARCLRRFH